MSAPNHAPVPRIVPPVIDTSIFVALRVLPSAAPAYTALPSVALIVPPEMLSEALFAFPFAYCIHTAYEPVITAVPLIFKAFVAVVLFKNIRTT